MWEAVAAEERKKKTDRGKRSTAAEEMQGDGGVRAAEEAGGRARQDGRDGGT